MNGYRVAALPTRLVCRISRTSAQAHSGSGIAPRAPANPAFETTRSIPPTSASRRVKRSTVASVSEMSSTNACARPPAAMIAATSRSSSSWRRAASHTSMPRAASRRARCNPIPLDAPVINARFGSFMPALYRDRRGR